MNRGSRHFSVRPVAAALAALIGLSGLAGGQAAAQELKLGMTITTTGPAAALGIPQKNTLAVLPETIGGLKLTVVQLDDGGDPATATTEIYTRSIVGSVRCV